MPRGLRISIPWLAATGAVAVAIWSNSLVPGAGSDAASRQVASSLQDMLAALGAGGAWVSNLLVRKMGHLLEYTLLGAVAARACSPEGRAGRRELILLVALPALVPAIDETIQLFVPGRSGRIADVLLDWCGCTLGAAISLALIRRYRRCQAR